MNAPVATAALDSLGLTDAVDQATHGLDTAKAGEMFDLAQTIDADGSGDISAEELAADPAAVDEFLSGIGLSEDQIATIKEDPAALMETMNFCLDCLGEIAGGAAEEVTGGPVDMTYLQQMVGGEDTHTH